MATNSRADLWDAMWAFKNHGKTQEAVFGREHPPGFRWLHERYRFAGLRLRLQFRLTELQSAIGRIQFQHLPWRSFCWCSASKPALPPHLVSCWLLHRY